jgi:HlyD family secretion protein
MSKKIAPIKTASLGLPVLGALIVAAVNGPLTRAQGAGETGGAEVQEKEWKAVAAGQVEPSSGEIKIAPVASGRISAVLVRAGDRVFPGRLLVKLDDEEARAQVEKSEAQVAMYKKIRNAAAASGRAAQRRKAEDSVADAESALVEARSALDQATASEDTGKRATNIDTLRQALARAQERLRQQQTELRRLEAQAGTPLPTQSEGQLNASRAELTAARAELEKTAVRAPIAATVLKVIAKPGEVAGPSQQQPMLLLGSISALRVRAELDERDFGQVAIGESAVVRADAFPGQEFKGRISSIGHIVEQPKIHSTGETNPVVEVGVDLAAPGPLLTGMRVDVFFP